MLVQGVVQPLQHNRPLRRAARRADRRPDRRAIRSDGTRGDEHRCGRRVFHLPRHRLLARPGKQSKRSEYGKWGKWSKWSKYSRATASSLRLGEPSVRLLARGA